MLRTGQQYRTFSGHNVTIFAFVGNISAQYPIVAYVTLDDGPIRLCYTTDGRSELAARELDIMVPKDGLPHLLTRADMLANSILRPFQVLAGRC